MVDVFTQTGAYVNQTLSAAFNPVTSVYGSDLYAGTDIGALNFLEKAWMQWYMYWGNPVIATGIMSFLLHEVCSTVENMYARYMLISLLYRLFRSSTSVVLYPSLLSTRCLQCASTSYKR